MFRPRKLLKNYTPVPALENEWNTLKYKKSVRALTKHEEKRYNELAQDVNLQEYMKGRDYYMATAK